MGEGGERARAGGGRGALRGHTASARRTAEVSGTSSMLTAALAPPPSLGPSPEDPRPEVPGAGGPSRLLLLEVRPLLSRLLACTAAGPRAARRGQAKWRCGCPKWLIRHCAPTCAGAAPARGFAWSCIWEVARVVTWANAAGWRCRDLRSTLWARLQIKTVRLAWNVLKHCRPHPKDAACHPVYPQCGPWAWLWANCPSSGALINNTFSYSDRDVVIHPSPQPPGTCF